MAEDSMTRSAEKKGEKEPASATPKSRRKLLMLLLILTAAVGILAGAGYYFAGPLLGKKGEKAADDKDAVIESLLEETRDAHGAGKRTAKAASGHGAKKSAGEKSAQAPSAFFFRPASPVRTNLKGSSLKVTAKLWIETEDEETVEMLQNIEPHIMNALVLLFSGKTREDVTTQEGIAQTSREIKVRVSRLAPAGKVKDAGFEYLTADTY